MVVYCGMQTPSEEQVPMEVFQRVLAENAEMKARLAWFERQIFGAKSERFVPDIPGQLPLNFGTAATPEILETVLAEQEAKRQVAAHERSVSKPNQNHQGRTELPGHLPRVEEVIEPEGELEDLKRIGEDVTEVLEYEVGKMWVRRIVRPRYVRPQAVQEQLEQLAEESGEPLPPSVIQAPAPDRPFPRYKAGVSMMVYLLIAKFVDHLPLYRISKQFARQGVKIPDSTLGQWTQAAADALEVLYDAYEKLIFKTPLGRI
jgi:transposase